MGTDSIIKEVVEGEPDEYEFLAGGSDKRLAVLRIGSGDLEIKVYSDIEEGLKDIRALASMGDEYGQLATKCFLNSQTPSKILINFARQCPSGENLEPGSEVRLAADGGDTRWAVVNYNHCFRDYLISVFDRYFVDEKRSDI